MKYLIGLPFFICFCLPAFLIGFIAAWIKFGFEAGYLQAIPLITLSPDEPPIKQMSTKPNDGGPAFPGIRGEDGNGNYSRIVLPCGESAWVAHNQGMPLRDYFAAAAIGGMCACADEHMNPDVGDIKKAAHKAYMIADAMIAEREKTP